MTFLERFTVWSWELTSVHLMLTMPMLMLMLARTERVRCAIFLRPASHHSMCSKDRMDFHLVKLPTTRRPPHVIRLAAFSGIV